MQVSIEPHHHSGTFIRGTQNKVIIVEFKHLHLSPSYSNRTEIKQVLSGEQLTQKITVIRGDVLRKVFATTSADVPQQGPVTVSDC